MNSAATLSTNIYYKPSGRFRPLGPLSVLLFGGIASALCGAIYSYAVFYIPFVYLNFILTLVFAFMVGVAVGLGIDTGHIRSPMVGLFLGVMVGAFANYCAWVTYFHALSGQQILEFDPLRLLAMIQTLAAKGSWSIRSFKPSGGLLYTIWGLEALIIIGGPILTAHSSASSPYCEDCKKWAEEKEVIGPLEPVDDKRELKEKLESRNYAPLMDLRKAARKKRFINLNFDRCPFCGHFNVLTIQQVKTTKNSKGEAENEELDLVSGLMVTLADYHRLQQAGRDAEEFPETDQNDADPELKQ